MLASPQKILLIIALKFIVPALTKKAYANSVDPDQTVESESTLLAIPQKILWNSS